MRVILSVIFFGCSFYGFTQNWVSLNKGIQFVGNKYLYLDQERNELYVHGAFFISGSGDTLRGIAKWNGFDFEALGKGVYYNPICYSMARYKGELYACGAWRYSPPFPSYLATYNDIGNTWDTIYNSSQNIERLSIVDGNLIMSGWSDTCFGLPTSGICSFDGEHWSSLLTLADEGGGFHNIYTVTSYHNQMYVGGNFYLPDAYGVMVEDIAILENNQLYQIGNGFQNGAVGSIQKMTVYKDELYICGGFHISNGDVGDYIVRWDGQTLKDVGGGTDAFIMDLLVHNGYLFALGYFDYAGGIYSPRVAYWDGTKWNPMLGEDLGPFGIGITRGAIYKDELYVVGDFETINGDTVNYVAKYNHQLPGDENSINIYFDNINEEIIVNYEDNNSYVMLVDISTVNGQQVGQYTLTNMQGYMHKSISISGMANGIYIVEATSNNKKVCKKLIKLN